MSGIYFLNGYLRPDSESKLRSILKKQLSEIDGVDPDAKNVRYYALNVSTAIRGDVIADSGIRIFLGKFENGNLQAIYELDRGKMKTALENKYPALKAKYPAWDKTMPSEESKKYRINPPKNLEDWVKDKKPVWTKEEDK